MQSKQFRSFGAVVSVLGMAACGGGGGGGGGGIPVDEVPPGAGTPALSDRTATGSFDVTYIVLDGDTFDERRTISFVGETGAISGGVLQGEDFDNGVIFRNPVSGEFSRVVQISGESVFGVVGLDVPSGDLPASGSVTNYNNGWVGLTATFEDDVLVLTGDAAFTVNWGGGGGITGTLSDFDIESSSTGLGSAAGSIVLTNGTVSGDDFNFNAGTISGTGSFAALGGSGSSSATTGTFFGPQADELGGIILILDPNDEMSVTGAFQAD